VLALLGLIAGDAAPAIMDPALNPLMPVLRSNYWLTIHVLTITLGYAAFALTLGLANTSLFYFFKSKKENKAGTHKKILEVNQLTYRAMQFGVVLIAAGTILGGIWADYSWGRFWGWDPKEVWALITLLCYLVILHGRYTNWVGQFGFAALSAVSFMSVVMAWYGVNFILGVGLHSYGFSSGGTLWVVGFVGLQLAYLLAATWAHFRSS
jgi:ABC-type transport system involved in cytochrome c biogenesis permease subunit